MGQTAAEEINKKERIELVIFGGFGESERDFTRTNSGRGRGKTAAENKRFDQH
jgi:hypothetical protein